MQANILFSGLKQFNHLFLVEPNGFIFQTDINFCLPVFGLVVNKPQQISLFLQKSQFFLNT